MTLFLAIGGFFCVVILIVASIVLWSTRIRYAHYDPEDEVDRAEYSSMIDRPYTEVPPQYKEAGKRQSWL